MENHYVQIFVSPLDLFYSLIIIVLFSKMIFSQICLLIPHLFFNFSTYHFLSCLKLLVLTIKLLSNSSAMDVGWKSPSSHEKKEIQSFEVVSVVNDIFVEQLTVRIALRAHKLDILTNQMEEAVEFLMSVLRCL